MPGEPVGLISLGVDTDSIGDIGGVDEHIMKNRLSSVVELGGHDSPLHFHPAVEGGADDAFQHACMPEFG